MGGLGAVGEELEEEAQPVALDGGDGDPLTKGLVVQAVGGDEAFKGVGEMMATAVGGVDRGARDRVLQKVGEVLLDDALLGFEKLGGVGVGVNEHRAVLGELNPRFLVLAQEGGKDFVGVVVPTIRFSLEEPFDLI